MGAVENASDTPSTDSIELQRWLDMARAGDRDSLGRLLDALHHDLLLAAHANLDGRLKQRIDAADIVQQTFLEAQRDLGSLRGHDLATFHAWLRNILRHNLAAAIARHVLAAKRSVGREHRQAEQSSAADPIVGAVGSTTSPSQRAIRNESEGVLMEALKQLPPNQAEAIYLRYVDGLSLVAICQQLNKSDTAVAGLLKRGLQKLRAILVEPESQC
jgi:RNA polymerase sigma-70 factor, ECF subfamily